MSLNIQFQKNKRETHTYSDLHLDLGKKIIPRGDKGDFLKSEANNDIRVDYDEYAIRNSLANLFSTSKKQRLLNPNYGLNLKQFLFGSVSENKAKIISRVIREGIKKYESRVVLEKIDIAVYPEDHSYVINIHVRIPDLQNKMVMFRGVFNENGLNVR